MVKDIVKVWSLNKLCGGGGGEGVLMSVFCRNHWLRKCFKKFQKFVFEQT